MTAPVRRIIPLSPEAKERFKAFVNQHGNEAFELPGSLAAAWSKLEGIALRLALVIHYAEWAAGNEFEEPEFVSLDSVERGIELCRWFGREAERVYAQLGVVSRRDRPPKHPLRIDTQTGSLSGCEHTAGRRQSERSSVVQDGTGMVYTSS
jgi:hypothetical protein